MYVFFQNYSQRIGVSSKNPLEGSVWQVLEIFEHLPEDDGSFLGLQNEDKASIQISKYNKYVWLIEMPVPEKGGSFQGFYTRIKVKEIIESLFNGLPFHKIPGLTFEKYL